VKVFINLFRQGLTPAKLAFTVALGLVIGCFPLFGITTILCAGLAIAFRLNLPTIQAGNYLATPLQLALIVPFGRLGERLFHAPHLPLAPSQWISMAKAAPDQTAQAVVMWQYHAIAAWVIFAAPALAMTTLVLKPLMGHLRRVMEQRGLVARA
jgi:uncharacterized protein (DUF2062 family)